jgi:hypothetical protein
VMISIDVGSAHSGTARLGIREIVRQLNSALGATLVATLAGGRTRRSATAGLGLMARNHGRRPRRARSSPTVPGPPFQA